MTKLFLALAAVAALAAPAAQAAPVDPGPDFEDLSQLKNLKLDIRYATVHNFANVDLYGDWEKCLLHKEAAAKLKQAAKQLAKEKPKWKLLIFDCLRPRSVQRKLWDVVKGTPNEEYVMNPDKGSVHNFGFAVDLSLEDENGKEVDMGTPYDNFTQLAQPRYEEENLKAGKLTKKQVENRLILRNLMTKAGFQIINNEWWHFDGKARSALAREGYKIVE